MILKLPHSVYHDFITLIVKSLKDKLDGSLVSVVLFGSVARREADEESDIDLLARALLN